METNTDTWARVTVNFIPLSGTEYKFSRERRRKRLVPRLAKGISV